MNRCIITTILTLLALLPAHVMQAQRKDTDAKWEKQSTIHCRDRKVTDTADVRILYAFNALDIQDKDTWIDEGQLKIGRNFTQYTSHFYEVNEDSLVNWLNAHPKSHVFPPGRWMQGYNPDHWIEYQHSDIEIRGNKLTEWATMPAAIYNENLYYTETLPLQAWVICDTTQTVCGYECRKATCSWRGRDYEAWFTTDIPLPTGPWKFGGLPGVIMKIGDATGTYTWEAVGVDTGRFPVYAPRRSKYDESTRQKVLDLQRKLNENYFKTTGTTVIVFKTGLPCSSRKHPYTQLELE